MKNYSSKINAFTLAEMLVVLFVIGVISMMTIPTVISTNKERVIYDLLAENYNKIETALIIDKIGDLDISEFNFNALEKEYSPEEFADFLTKKIKVLNVCKPSGNSCGFNSNTLNGYKLRLITGSALLINDDFKSEKDPADSSNKILGSTYIDIDGPNGPNSVGRDQFGFYTTKKGLIPMGGPMDNIVPFDECIKTEGLSNACTAWLLLNKNMNYKNCPKKINWNDKIVCN